MNTRIIVDSTTDLMPEVKGRVSVVPFTVHFGDEEYIDGVTIDHKSFYESWWRPTYTPPPVRPRPRPSWPSMKKRGQPGTALW